MVQGPHFRTEPSLKSSPPQEGQGFEDTGTYCARFEEPTNEGKNYIVNEPESLEQAFSAKMVFNDGNGSYIRDAKIDDGRVEIVSGGKAGHSEELELVSHLTEPRTRHGRVFDSTSRRRSSRKKGRRKRGASLEREITMLVLQNIRDTSLEKYVALSREELGENGNLSTNEILSDLVKTSAASSISSQSKETVRWINTTARVLEQIQSMEEHSHQEEQVETVDAILHPTDDVVAANEMHENQIEPKASDLVDASNITVVKNEKVWAAFEEWSMNVPQLPSQVLDQNGFPVFDVETTSDEDSDSFDGDELRAEEEQLAAELSMEMASELERDRVQELSMLEVLARKTAEEKKLREMTKVYATNMADETKTRELKGETDQQRAEEEEQQEVENQEIGKELVMLEKMQMEHHQQVTSTDISEDRTREMALGLRRAGREKFRRIPRDPDASVSNCGDGQNRVNTPFILRPRPSESTRTDVVLHNNEAWIIEDELSTSSSDAQQVQSVAENLKCRTSSLQIEDSLETEMPIDRVDSPSNDPETDINQNGGQMESFQCRDSPETSASDGASSGNNTNEPVSPGSVTDLNSTNGNLALRYNRAKAFVKRRSVIRHSSHYPKPTWNPKPPIHYNSRAVGEEP